MEKSRKMVQKDLKKKKGKNQEIYSKMESLGKYLTFRNRPGNRPEEGSLLLKRTKKGTGEGS